MFTTEKITFIGGGVMGEAMIAALLRQHQIDPQHITACDPIKERGEFLIKEFGVRYSADNVEGVQETDIIVLSVKPQFLDDVLAGLNGKIKTGVLIISIVAGVPIEKIMRGFEIETVVRVMPNTPARIGQGMSVWTATDAVSDIQRNQTRAILQSLGKEIFVEKEYFLDMATALSGSGPAYIFLFIEALIDAGVQMGFSHHVAKEMVLQTVSGSVELARQYPHHPAELKNMVTSPGGTTADALYQLEKGGFRAIISKAVFAAYQKSIALGGNDQ
jgi:pyrroline-5-carboxylate reductase